MIRFANYIGLLFCSIAFISCGGPLFKMQLPPGMEGTYHSGKMHRHLFGKEGSSVLGYKAGRDSVISSSYGDTTVNFGLILPRTKIVGTKSTLTRVYGNDSLHCLLNYDTHEIYSSAAQGSLLLDMVLPADKNEPGYKEEQRNIISYYKYFKGYLNTGDANDTAFFFFEQTKVEKTLDTALITGYITYRQDSFLLRPYYWVVPQNKKKNKYTYMLEGFGLYNQGELVAFLQHAPLIEPGKEILQIHTKTTTEKQLILAAYLTLLYDRLNYP